MKAIHLFLAALLTWAVSTPAWAYLTLTYTSADLQLIEATLNGGEHPTAWESSAIPHFFVTFESTRSEMQADGSRTMFLQHSKAEIRFPFNLSEPLEYTQQSPAWISFDNKGGILGWNFALLFSRPASPDNAYPGEHFSLIESSYGADTCNCDRAYERYDLFTGRPYYQYAYVGTVALGWQLDSSIANWTITNVEVPEPGAGLLSLLVFGLLFAVRSYRNID